MRSMLLWLLLERPNDRRYRQYPFTKPFVFTNGWLNSRLDNPDSLQQNDSERKAKMQCLLPACCVLKLKLESLRLSPSTDDPSTRLFPQESLKLTIYTGEFRLVH